MQALSTFEQMQIESAYYKPLKLNDMNEETNEVLAIPFEVAEQEEAPKGEYQLEKITPQMAADYLKTNTQNRPLKSGLVKFYASEMQAGNWRCAMAAPIVFDWDGILQDGQHRLQAIVLSGCTIEMWVARNSDPNDFAVIDTGKTRGINDVLAINGIKNANNVAAIIKRYFALCRNKTAINSSIDIRINGLCGDRSATKSILTNRNSLDIYYESPELWQEAVNFAQSTYNKMHLLMAAFIGGLYVYLYKIKGNDIDTIKGFFDELVGASTNNTIILLRKKLVEDSQKPRDRRMTDAYKQKLVAKAWNYYRRGRILKVLKVQPDEEVDFD